MRRFFLTLSLLVIVPLSLMSCGKKEDTNVGRLSIQLVLPVRTNRPQDFEVDRLTQIEKYSFHFSWNGGDKVIEIIRRDFLDSGFVFSDIPYDPQLHIEVKALNFVGVPLARGEQTVNYHEDLQQSVQIFLEEVPN